MNNPNIFNSVTIQNHLTRLERLTPTTQPVWGKMTAAQMLAHLNVAYNLSEGDFSKNHFLKKLLLKSFVKPMVCNNKPYSKNNPTSPAFKITDIRDFNIEKNK